MQQTLNRSQDSRDVIRRRPTVLQNVEAQFSVGVDVGVKHLRDELDDGRLVRVRFVKGQDEAEGAVFEGGVGCREKV